MRHALYTPLLLLGLLTACSKPGLVGKWKLIANSTPGQFEQAIYEFKSNKHYSMESGVGETKFLVEGKYEYSGDKVTLLSMSMKTITGGTTVKMGEDVKLKDQGKPNSFTYIMKDSNTLVINGLNGETVTLERVR
ncbi:MAG: hypothetical protein KF824_01460 [Fimbriimonadaceae bacterium]|nr:MAG: hypothetical protein KF824_01460 [Fimbriimonadaceae bacterium]